jgi:Kef-type K+ transport system membrane component KefB
MDPATFARFALVLAIVLAAAKVGGMVAEALGQPSVLGELLAGVAVGPSVLGRLSPLFVDPADTELQLLAQVGVMLLLFAVGLETDLGGLLRSGPSALLVACIGVAVPVALGFGATWLLAAGGLVAAGGGRVLLALFVGATLAATSVGITARVLQDLGRMASREARILLGAAVLDDLLGLVVLAVLGAVGAAAAQGLPAAQAVGAGLVLRKLVVAAAFLAGAIALGRLVAPRVVDMLVRRNTRSLLVVGATCLALLLGVAAHAAGSAPIIGAFAAGVVLAGARRSATLHELMQPVVDVFTPIFFVVVGAAVDLAVLDPRGASGRRAIVVVLVLLTCAIAGKLVSGLGVIDGKSDRMIVGVGMIPRGEVGLVFAQAGAALVLPTALGPAPLLDPPLYASLALVVMLTTLIAPPLLRRAIARRDARTP